MPNIRITENTLTSGAPLDTFEGTYVGLRLTHGSFGENFLEVRGPDGEVREFCG